MQVTRGTINSGKSGLTLIELLFSMSITSMLLLALAALVSQSTDGFNQSQRTVNQLSQSRAFYQIFQSELSLRLPDTPLLHEDGDSGGGISSDKIVFVRSLPEQEQMIDSPGDIAASYYYVAYSEDASHRSSPKLFRKILNPTETYDLIEHNDSAKTPEPIGGEPFLDGVLSFQVNPMYLDPISNEYMPWNKSMPHSPCRLEINVRTIDDSISRNYSKQAEWERLIHAPNKNEQRMIHAFSCELNIGK
jgi:type II secretory pathway pseudopilin PulG